MLSKFIFSKFLSLRKYFNAFSSSHSLIFLNHSCCGFSSKDFIKLWGLSKLRLEFLQNNDFISSNLWFSKRSTSSALISLHSPVIPKFPSFRYLPALPAIWPISERLSFLNFLPFSKKPLLYSFPFWSYLITGPCH